MASSSTASILRSLFRLPKNNALELDLNLDKVKVWATSLRAGFKIMGSFVGKECSPIFAQRVFRTYRVVSLHSKLWGVQLAALRPLSKRALFSLLIVSLCDSPRPFNSVTGERITEKELIEHMKDLDFIHDLTAATVVCPYCKDRLVVDKKVTNVKYCHCKDTKSAYDKKVKGFAWTPFVETADLLIWRMPHPDQPGFYMYKVYGYYNDISAEDFLNTQLDVEYRKKWDDTVLKLELVESNKEIDQDVIYWEMKWPTMFSNRDYLFARRHYVDKPSKTIVIISKALGPSHVVPEKKGIHRVKEYWSVMQVTAVDGLSDPGVEFGLTYFDNPGVSLPQWMSNWAAMTAIPEFLDKQRNAARIKRGSKKSFSKSLPHSQSQFSDREHRNHLGQSSQHQNNQEKEHIQSQSQELLKNASQTQPPVSVTTPQVQDASKNDLILSQFFKESRLSTKLI